VNRASLKVAVLEDSQCFSIDLIRRPQQPLVHFRLLNPFSIALPPSSGAFIRRPSNAGHARGAYTHAVPAALREANSKVVRLVLPAQVA
jgi:hypothetical protein